MLFPHVRQPVYNLQNGQAVNTLERLFEQGPGCKAPTTALLSQLNHLQGQQAASAEAIIYFASFHAQRLHTSCEGLLEGIKR